MRGPAASELMTCRPERAVEDERDGELVVLLRPRFRRGPLARWLQPVLRRPFLRVHLDEVGTFIWSRCDGETTVAEIAEALEARFGARVAPALDRLSLFIAQMHRNGLIRLCSPTID